MTAAVATQGRRGIALGIAGVALVFILLAAVVAGDGRRSGPELDPRSTEPAGARALDLLLDRSGIAADVGDLVAATDERSVWLLRDNLDGDTAAELTDWIARGGTLIVSDPRSDFTPASTGRAALRDAPGRCDLGQLGDVMQVDIDRATGLVGPGCFDVAGGNLVVDTTFGNGRIIAVGSADVFRNDRIGDADHAVLAVRVAQLAGRPVRLLVPTPVGAGTERLRDLVSPSVWTLLAVGGLAFAVYALVRARRFGRPVPEPQLTPIDAGRLTEATGRLLDASGASEQSAAALHRRLRNDLTRRAGVPPDAAPDDVVRHLRSHARGSDVPADLVLAAVSPPRVHDDAGLVAYATAVARLRAALTRPADDRLRAPHIRPVDAQPAPTSAAPAHEPEEVT